MEALSQMRRSVVWAIGAGILIYAGFGLYAELGSVLRDLATFSWWLLIPALALSSCNYAVRFVRWQLLLRRVDIHLPWRSSLSIFLAGMAMTLTPGKIGELLKSWLLKEQFQIPLTRSAPVVVVERVTDLLALVVIAGLGVGRYYEQGTATVAVLGAGLTLAIVVAAYEPLAHGSLHLLGRFPGGGRISSRLHELYRSARELLAAGPLVAGTTLGIVAWGLECAGLWVVLTGSGVPAAPLITNFIYAFSTLAGVVSPGGLGVTDGLLVLLMCELLPTITRSLAVAAAFVIRLCTLWFAVGIGAWALLRFDGRQQVSPPGPTGSH